VRAIAFRRIIVIDKPTLTAAQVFVAVVDASSLALSKTVTRTARARHLKGSRQMCLNSFIGEEKGQKGGKGYSAIGL